MRKCGGTPPCLRCYGEGVYFFPLTTMLWKYSMPFGGMIDAPADLVAARNLLIEKIKADPGALITKLEPAEPSCKTLSDVFKRAVGG